MWISNVRYFAPTVQDQEKMMKELDQEDGTKNEGHILIVPYPSQGHINPMLQFSKRIISKGLKITLAIILHASKTMGTKIDLPIAIETISVGFDDGGSKEAGGLSVLDVTKDLGVIGAAFFTQSCIVGALYYSVQKGLVETPVPAVQAFSVPGLSPLSVSDVPCFVAGVEPYPFLLDYLANQFANIHKADWVLFSTFDKLDSEQMEEVAMALSECKHNFLWVVRAAEECKIPSKFLEEITPEKGLIIRWCPQLEVLSHPAV
ncbi:UDP-glycosyltransferase 74F2-like [Papaver somniferum]|uniref:UDP-glycosyltransferase 74F2-like n=1 Tax=Papaver somniferum TaxID=3469 RepID=UPI000E703CEE|nr:UDP-glycosyltransferase 74F2-like [Papaver somniferum]